MKPTHLITLMAALAIGSANAAGTLAGTTIDNVATATFEDPAGGTTPVKVASNNVSTTVLPKSFFNITYVGASDSDATDSPAGALYVMTNVDSGSEVVFSYAAVNTGNDEQDIALTTEVAGNGLSESDVKYYLDINADGILQDGERASAKTSINVKADEIVKFFQVYVVKGVENDVLGATPIGQGNLWNDLTKQNVPNVREGKDSAPWWQFNKVVIGKSQLTNNPNTILDTDKVELPPTGSTPVPGYLSGTTRIAVSTDEQIAYPKSDNDTPPVADSVVFTNTLKNDSSVADTVTLSVVPKSGLPAGYTQIVTQGAASNVFTVTQTYDPAIGSPVTTVATVTLDKTRIALGAKGSASASDTYTVTVAYADPDALNPTPIYLAIGAESGNDLDAVVDDTTFDTIYPAAMQFNDKVTGTPETQLGTAGNNVVFPMVVSNLGEYGDTYTLSGYTVVTLLDGSRQIVPIVYSGTGVSSSSSSTVQVDLNGDGDTTDAGESLSIPVYTTGAVNANSTLDVNATVTLPVKVRANRGTDYLLNQTATAVYSGISLQDTNDKITVALAGGLGMAKFTQKAGTTAATEYVLDGKVTSDGSDPKAVANPANYSANSTSYVPGVEYSYKIIAKNTYNVRIEKFFLSDTLNSNLTFVSVLGTISGNTIVDLVGSPDTSGTSVIYSTDGTTWSVTAPTSGTTLYVAVDDPSQVGYQPGSLDPDATLDMTITVKIN